MPLWLILDIAYSLLVDEYQRLGMDLVSAMDEVKEYRAFPSFSEQLQAGAHTQAKAVVNERQNDQALAQLEQMMKGVPGLK